MKSSSNRDNDKDLIKKYFNRKLKQMEDAFKLQWAEMETELEPFLETIDIMRDRELAILSSSLLDDYLEAIITASYIKNEKGKSIFEDEHVLQSFYSKINVAYFSGLIPRWLYKDLRLICEIRNKFAHKFMTNLEFTNEAITRKIDHCELRPKTLDGVKASRLKFTIVVIQAVATLKYIHVLLNHERSSHLVDIYDMNNFDYESMALTKAEIIKIGEKMKAK